MPSRGQKGGAMNDSFAQQIAQTPSPATGSRQATHSVGSAMSSAIRADCLSTPRHAESAPRRWLAMERDGDASASMGSRLTPPRLVLKAAESKFIAPQKVNPTETKNGLQTISVHGLSTSPGDAL